MTDILVPASVWDDLVEALLRSQLVEKELNGPIFEPDGGITWDNGSSIVLALYKEGEEPSLRTASNEGEE